jgi:starvation-inducible DNA-binding protein
MKTTIGISNKNLEAVAALLSTLLADEYILYTKTRNAHWNVTGADFYDKHKFFESQYETLDGFIDNIAERIRTLGQASPATLASFLKLTTLKEQNFSKTNSTTYLQQLLADHETICQNLRKQIEPINNKYNDVGTADFLTGLLEEHEKMAWFLRAHL